MNQGVFLVVLVLLLMIILCKILKRCNLLEFFLNRAQANEILNAVYGVKEGFKRECREDEKKLMSNFKMNQECSNPDTNEGFVNCDALHPLARKKVPECAVENFEVPDVCCTTEMYEAGAKGGVDCNPNCPVEGFDNYNAFKEDFQDVETLAPVDYKAYRDASPNLRS